MTDKLPPLSYYKWHWQSWRANRKVQRMTYIERGLYRELLDECWSEGFIPNNIETMAEICGCPVDIMASAWQVLSNCFVLLDGVFINERMDRERTEKDFERAKRARAGKVGGLHKALNANDNLASAKQVPSTCHIEEKRREEKRREEGLRESIMNGIPTVVERAYNGTPTNQEPITDNLEPITDIKALPAKTNKWSALTCELPEGINVDAWRRWAHARSSRKKPISELAAQAQWKTLMEYSKDVQGEMIKSSIANDYQGIFPPKGNTKQSINDKISDQSRFIPLDADGRF